MDPRTLWLAVAATTFASPAPADQAMHHDHEAHHHHGASSAAGSPGNPAKVSRSIAITAVDMRYEPTEIRVKSGETVRLTFANQGQLRHEFMIGNLDEQRAHEEMMKDMPDMKHDDASTVTLEPGQKGALIWKFGKPGTYEIGCHIPGHYGAGMRTRIVVTARNS